MGLADAPGELSSLAATFDRMAAAVAREDELRRRLVADVAHEVRTPLTILQGTTEALVDKLIEPDDATLDSLHKEVLRLVQLVVGLDTLAAADAAGLHLDRRPIDLVAVAAAVVDLARPATAGARVQLATNLWPARVDADDARMRQVVTTLVANAIAYTPAGGTITVGTGTADGAAFLEVSDTGPGIDAPDLPHLFDRFYRGRAARGTSGSGIGLAIAHELVAAHGGVILASNGPEGGSVFTVRLPLSPE